MHYAPPPPRRRTTSDEALSTIAWLLIVGGVVVAVLLVGALVLMRARATKPATEVVEQHSVGPAFIHSTSSTRRVTCPLARPVPGVIHGGCVCSTNGRDFGPASEAESPCPGFSLSVHTEGRACVFSCKD